MRAVVIRLAENENLILSLPGEGETLFVDDPDCRVIDVGSGSRFLLATYEGLPVGGIWQHSRHGHPQCGGVVVFRGYQTCEGSGAQWDLISLDPLTLSPSLLCNVCGRHVHIRDGREV